MVNQNFNTSGVLFSSEKMACFMPVTDVMIGGFKMVWSTLTGFERDDWGAIQTPPWPCLVVGPDALGDVSGSVSILASVF